MNNQDRDVETVVDLRSDTLTAPTQEMRDAMYRAVVGDDVWDEDPTVKELEAFAAGLVCKEAALFMPSGTMGNQVAAMTHLPKRGMEVVVEADSHIFYYEVGGLAVISGAHVRAIPGQNGILNPNAVELAIRDANVHMPTTGLICLENTHNRAGGTVMTPEQTSAIADVAHKRGVPVHLDGARIFNGAVALGVDVAELTKDVDSVMFCLSKGLGAPVGSLLAGDAGFIKGARKNRKMLGGGMRQVGILASAGMVALATGIDRLIKDHELARTIGQHLASLDGISIDMSTVQSNILVFGVESPGSSSEVFVNFLSEEGVLASAFGPSLVRFVTHRDVPDDAAIRTIEAVERVLRRMGLHQPSA